MTKKFFKTTHNDNEIRYSVTKRKQSKNIKMSIGGDALVHVSIPYIIPIRLAHNFVSEKADWIIDRLSELEKQEKFTIPEMSRQEYSKYRLQAYELTLAKIRKFNQHYNLPYNRICIKDQKTRWGSCSSNKNLNFNYKILFLPDHLVEYIVVHELCHLEEMNHSKDFWNLVGECIGCYRESRRELKEIRIVSG